MGASNVHAEGSARGREDTLGRSACARRDGEEPWCVDLGHAIVCASSRELAALLAGGTLRTDTKVWRDGMGYWTELWALDAEDLAPLGLPVGWHLTPPAPPTRPVRTRSASHSSSAGRRRTGARAESRPRRAARGRNARPARGTWPWVTALACLLVAGTLYTALFAPPLRAPEREPRGANVAQARTP